SSCSGCEGIGIGNLQYRPAARHKRDRMTGEPANLCRSHAGGGATDDSCAARRLALPVPPAIGEQAGGFVLIGTSGDPSDEWPSSSTCTCWRGSSGGWCGYRPVPTLPAAVTVIAVVIALSPAWAVIWMIPVMFGVKVPRASPFSRIEGRGGENII